MTKKTDTQNTRKLLCKWLMFKNDQSTSFHSKKPERDMGTLFSI